MGKDSASSPRASRRKTLPLIRLIKIESNKMKVIESDFPYEEIRRESGDYFSSWQEAKDAGFDDNQIWSITECEGTFCYGAPHHYVNHIGHIATNERHDFETYYEETIYTNKNRK